MLPEVVWTVGIGLLPAQVNVAVFGGILIGVRGQVSCDCSVFFRIQSRLGTVVDNFQGLAQALLPVAERRIGAGKQFAQRRARNDWAFTIGQPGSVNIRFKIAQIAPGLHEDTRHARTLVATRAGLLARECLTNCRVTRI